MNEITADGLLKVDTCQPTTYVRHPNLIVQSACTSDARVLCAFPKGLDRGLDLVEATVLRNALDRFLADNASVHQRGWLFSGCLADDAAEQLFTLDLDLTRASQGRVRPFLGWWWRFGRWQDGVPMMLPVGQNAPLPDELVNTDGFPLTHILGLCEL
jgi:hypothetical protein